MKNENASRTANAQKLAAASKPAESGAPNFATANVETAANFNKPFLRPDEAAAFLGVSRRTLSNLQRRKTVSYAKLNRVVIFKTTDLLAAVERFRVHAVGG